MSYILDALKKAAEQRGASGTALLRPSAPLGRVGRLRRLPWIVAGALLLFNVAGLIYLLRPATVIAPATPPVPTPRVALIQPIEPPAPPPTQVIEVERPRPPAPVKASAVKPTPEKPVVRVVPDPRPATVEPKVTPPASPRPDAPKYKLEVLSYSDIPAQRLVFINGRRYREGDTLDGGAKVEEIREDGVILSDQGQRFTLR